MEAIERYLALVEKIKEAVPTPEVPQGSDAESLPKLFEAISTISGNMAYLKYEAATNDGEVLMRKRSYEAVLAVAKTRLSKENKWPNSYAEQAKEDAANAEYENVAHERLLWASSEALQKALRGMLEAYEAAYNGVSRLITLVELETATQGGRVR